MTSGLATIALCAVLRTRSGPVNPMACPTVPEALIALAWPVHTALGGRCVRLIVAGRHGAFDAVRIAAEAASVYAGVAYSAGFLASLPRPRRPSRVALSAVGAIAVGLAAATWIVL